MNIHRDSVHSKSPDNRIYTVYLYNRNYNVHKVNSDASLLSHSKVSQYQPEVLVKIFIKCQYFGFFRAQYYYMQHFGIE